MSQPGEGQPDGPVMFGCPQCSIELSAVTLGAVTEKVVQVDTEEQATGSAVTLCPACGTLLVFDAPLDVTSLRVATDEEAAPWADLPHVVSTRAALALTDDPDFADELASIMRGEGAR